MTRIVIDARKIADFGIGTYIRGLLHGLSALEGDETFVVLAPRGKWVHVPDSPRIERVAFDAPHYSLRELAAVDHAARDAGADLLHAPHYVVPMTSIPVVVTIHDLIHLRLPQSPFHSVYARWMIGRAVRSSAAVLTVSRTVADDVRSRFTAAQSKIHVTPNGIDETMFEPISDPEDRVRNFGCEPHRYFLFVGNDKPHKNLATLVEAFEKLGDDFQLVVAGGPRKESSGQIIRTGFVSDEDLRALYACSIALVVPSLYEGFGLPATEAMAAGTAVIASTGGALPEVTGGAALLFDPVSADDLEGVMRRVSREPELRARLVEEGRRHARTFSWRRMAEQTMQVYRDALR